MVATLRSLKPSFSPVHRWPLAIFFLGRDRATIRRLSAGVTAILTSALLSAPFLPGQDKTDDDVTTISVDVQVVNVLATVRDKQGRIVSDLTPR